MNYGLKMTENIAHKGSLLNKETYFLSKFAKANYIE